jgi:glucarate dehydratase
MKQDTAMTQSFQTTSQSTRPQTDRIVEVRVTPIALKDPPLLNASGVHEPYTLRAIIEVELQSGITGLGETYGDMPGLTHLRAVAPMLRGLHVTDMLGLRYAVGTVVSQQGLVQASSPVVDVAPGTLPGKAAAKTYAVFEAAMLDAQARCAQLPLADYLGGRARDRVAYSAYLFFKYAQHIDAPYEPDTWGEALDPVGIVAQARKMIDEYGFKSIKLKAGALPPDVEVDSLLALKAAFTGLPLRIDPNANWSLATALRVAQRLGDCLEYYEDPVGNLSDAAQLRQQTALLLATNMVVTNWHEFRENIALQGIQVVLTDHHFWGGIRATEHLASMCDTFGLGLSMHSNSHAGISLMTMTHLASTLPNLKYACDTHYPWQCEDVIAGGRIKFVDGCVMLTDAPGIGVELDQVQLARLHQQYLQCGYTRRDDEAQMRKYLPNYRKSKPRY